MKNIFLSGDQYQKKISLTEKVFLTRTNCVRKVRSFKRPNSQIRNSILEFKLCNKINNFSRRKITNYY